MVQSRFARILTPALSQGERGKYSEAIWRLNPAIPSRTLATLRDRLVPKLLSGEISVSSFSPAVHYPL